MCFEVRLRELDVIGNRPCKERIDGIAIFLNFKSLFSFLGSSLNAVVVFNLEFTHAARFALKTTAAFNEEPKKENLAWKTERL